MIQLDVEQYCHKGCPDFEAKTHKYSSENLKGDNNTDTIIFCERRNHCKNLINFLSRVKENGGNENE